MRMGLGWIDGMVIIGHRSSKSTFDAKKAITCSPLEEMTFIISLDQSILDRHLAAHEYWKASQMIYWKARMFANDQLYLHLFKISKNPDIECLQNLPTTFSWSITPLSGTSWLSSYLYLTSPPNPHPPLRALTQIPLRHTSSDPVCEIHQTLYLCHRHQNHS